MIRRSAPVLAPVLALAAFLVLTAGAAPARQAAPPAAGSAATAATAEPGAVPTPEEIVGFPLGTDGRLASWSALVSYYDALGAASERVEVRRLGETTLGNPFLLVLISSPENLARADRLAEINRRLADPRGLDRGGADGSGDRVDALVAEGRATVAVTVGLHSTEVAATQMAPLLAHELATGDDPETRRILDETVFLLFPCFNPDGTEMIVDWVDRTRGTAFEGSRYPDLYHHYAGHDDNRDAYMLNLAESRLFAEVVYREWLPQMYLDVHQMGSYGARLYVPPYDDPINPNVDPLIWTEHELAGAAMEVDLERAGVHGVVAGSPFTGWWFPSFHMVTNHHNIAGMLTETASAKMAWPLRIHPQQLRPHGRKHELYGPMQIFPHPWPGGWWTLEDMIRQQRISTRSLLATAARNRELLLRNMVFKARRTIERGRTEPPVEFVIPAGQHDPLTVDELVARLMANGVEISRATGDFVHEGRAYEAGSYVVSTAQPKGVLVRSLLGRIHYPDDATTRRADGSVIPPYDLAAFVLAEHMGVEAVPVGSPVGALLEDLAAPPRPAGEVRGTGQAGWLVSHATNASFRVTNRVLEQGGEVYWLRSLTEADGRTWPVGTLWIPAGDGTGDGAGGEVEGPGGPESMAADPTMAVGQDAEPGADETGMGDPEPPAAPAGNPDAARIEELAAETGVSFHALARPPEGSAWRLKPLRLGMYRRYLGGNMDEGWTRLLFDRWGFPYERIEADDVRAGALADLDVFLVPADDLEALRGEGNVPEPPEGEPEAYPEIFLPPEATEGLDEEAIGALKGWVRGGGTLVLLDEASALAWEELGVPVANAVEGLPPEEYLCPGSTLRARFDTGHPLAYGMPGEALILNRWSPAFEIERSALNERISTPIVYPEDAGPGESLLRSGWLLGAEHLEGKAAALDVEYGDGRILMIGFRSQHRAQTHGTFKVFF
ncbi:MAG: M14 family metallopeptidase, partial [Acidobacteriota bacterium]